MSTLFRVCAVLTLVGCSLAVVLHFTGENLEKRLFGPERTIGSDFLHLVIGFAAVYVLVAVLRPRPRG